jgi:hypothetical protein
MHLGAPQLWEAGRDFIDRRTCFGHCHNVMHADPRTFNNRVAGADTEPFHNADNWLQSRR